MPWQKGQSGNPNGRAKGARTHLTADVRAIARSLLDDPDYRAALHERLKAGTAGTMEVTLWAYAYGRPALDSPTDGMLPTSITIHF